MPPTNDKPVQQPTKTAPQENAANVAHANVTAPVDSVKAQEAPKKRDILRAISLLKDINNLLIC